MKAQPYLLHAAGEYYKWLAQMMQGNFLMCFVFYNFMLERKRETLTIIGFFVIVPCRI